MDDRLKTFRLHLRRALYVPLLMAAVLAATFLLEMYFLWSTNRSVQDSYQSINHTRSVLKRVLDMETGLRGYLLTGDYRFMGPYYAAEDYVSWHICTNAALGRWQSATGEPDTSSRAAI